MYIKSASHIFLFAPRHFYLSLSNTHTYIHTFIHTYIHTYNKLFTSVARLVSSNRQTQQVSYYFEQDLFQIYQPINTPSLDFHLPYRAMPKAGYTGAHVDSVYMSRGSPDLLTMWTPLGDVAIEMGVLAVCEASHRLSE